MGATNTASKEKFEKFVTDPKVDASAREKLVIARIGLLLNAPFFGNMATRLDLVNADDWCPTAATDGRKFYYNSEFVNKLKDREIEFLFGHEVLHVCYDHMGRFGDRIMKLANIAADYCVNADLVDQKVGVKITTVPCLYDPKYRGWAFEQVYEDLFKNVKQINIDDLMKMLLDDHMESSDGDDGDKEGNGEGKNSRPKLTDEEKQQIKDEIKEAMLSAAQAVGAGNCPAGIQRLLKDLTEPKMNWREILQQQVEGCIKSDFSWMRASRRGWHADAIMPGMMPEPTIEIAAAIDMSGSITDAMAKDFLSEVNGIMQQYSDYKITLWTFDTQVYNPQEFTADNGDELLEYETMGGGGTSFQVNWEFMKVNDIVPKMFIMFTDMESFDGYGDPDYCDTVFISNNRRDIEAPHGITVKYE